MKIQRVLYVIIFAHELYCIMFPVLKNMSTLSLLQIHWFSIFNSFMMVIFLVGLVSMILMRTLRKDYARYSREEDLDDLVRGWVGPGAVVCKVTNCRYFDSFPIRTGGSSKSMYM